MNRLDFWKKKKKKKKKKPQKKKTITKKHPPVFPFTKRSPGLRSEMQVTRDCIALDPRSFWRSSLGTGIQGKTIAITLQFWMQPSTMYHSLYNVSRMVLNNRRHVYFSRTIIT